MEFKRKRYVLRKFRHVRSVRDEHSKRHASISGLRIKREHMMEFISFGPRQGSHGAVRVKAVENGLGCTGTVEVDQYGAFPFKFRALVGGSSLSMTLVRLQSSLKTAPKG
jgi:hypothetical protein